MGEERTLTDDEIRTDKEVLGQSPQGLAADPDQDDPGDESDDADADDADSGPVDAGA